MKVHVLYAVGGGMLQLEGVTKSDDARDKWKRTQSRFDMRYESRTFEIDDPELLRKLGVRTTKKGTKKR